MDVLGWEGDGEGRENAMDGRSRGDFCYDFDRLKGLDRDQCEEGV